MTISKKLFLIAAVALNLGSLIHAFKFNEAQYTNQEIFNFAATLSQQNNDNAKVVSQWLIENIGKNGFDTHKISLIINSPLTLEEKVERLAQLKPGLIKRYAINPLYNITTALKKGLIFSTKTAAIIAIPAIFILSAETGANVAKQCFGKLLIQWQ